MVLPDFAPREVSTSDLYFALINLAGEDNIEFIEIQDCKDTVVYMIEEIAFYHIVKQDGKLELSEMEMLTLSELVTATVVAILNIPYTIPNDFSYHEIFSNNSLSGSLLVFIECTKYIMNEIDKISFV